MFFPPSLVFFFHSRSRRWSSTKTYSMYVVRVDMDMIFSCIHYPASGSCGWCALRSIYIFVQYRVLSKMWMKSRLDEETLSRNDRHTHTRTRNPCRLRLFVSQRHGHRSKFREVTLCWPNGSRLSSHGKINRIAGRECCLCRIAVMVVRQMSPHSTRRKPLEASKLNIFVRPL